MLPAHPLRDALEEATNVRWVETLQDRAGRVQRLITEPLPAKVGLALEDKLSRAGFWTRAHNGKRGFRLEITAANAWDYVEWVAPHEKRQADAATAPSRAPAR